MVTGAFHVVPPFADEMNPTINWHVDTEQMLCG